MRHELSVTILSAALMTTVSLGMLHVVSAQVMSSNNFSIQSDSINVGGGLGTSENYAMESTVGELATGDSESETYQLRAGFQQMQEVFISLTGAQTVDLSPSIGGVTGGESNGSTTVTVVTDSPSGYSLSIIAETSPAMQSGSNTLDDYVPVSGADVDFLYGIDDALFGFSPTGVDVTNTFRDNGLTCGGGDSNPETCWAGLSSTTPTILASRTGSNHPLGATTTIHFRVGVGTAALPATGLYIATTTLTALPL
jgi:hypothetical protein